MIENADFKVLWDMKIQCDQEIHEKKTRYSYCIHLREAKLVDIAWPGDSRIREKEREKIERTARIIRKVLSL